MMQCPRSNTASPDRPATPRDVMRGLSRRAFLVSSLSPLAVAVLAGCRTGGVRRAGSPVERELPILWNEHGTYSRLRRRVRLVVRDAATLARIPLTPVPVDFDSQMVLIAGLGPTNSEHAGIRITRVWREGSEIHVQERLIHPGPEESAARAVASPWTICVVPASDLNVRGYDTRVPKNLLRD